MIDFVKILVIAGAGLILGLIVYSIMHFLEKPKTRRVAVFIDILGVLLAVVIVGGLYFYLFIISPTFVEKPYMEKPFLYVTNASTKEEIVNEQHIAYIINEMGGFKLHNDPLSKTPAEFEFILTDFNRTYTVRVNEHTVISWLGSTDNPDGRIYGKQETVILLFQSNNFRDDLVRFVNTGELRAELLADSTTLALKGYKGIYDTFR